MYINIIFKIIKTKKYDVKKCIKINFKNEQTTDKDVGTLMFH